VKANTILHGKKTLIPMVTNIRTGVVLDQGSLKQDARGVSVDFLLSPWAKQDCNNMRAMANILTAKRKGKQSVQKMFSREDVVTKDELKWMVAFANNNIPFRFSDTFSKLLPELCPDFKIAKFFSSCRTKTSYIIRHAFGETFDEELSLDLDESTDTVDKKQLEINVRYYNESKCEVATDFNGRKYTAHPKAEEITDHIQ